MKQSPYTALLDKPDLAGAITMWSLSGSIDVDVLAREWADRKSVV